MQPQTTITSQIVTHIAELANIPVTDQEKTELTKGFNTVIQVLDVLKNIDVSGVEPTHQVTGLENIFREDVIDTKRMFTQQQALANAPKVYNGCFVVKQILDR